MWPGLALELRLILQITDALIGYNERSSMHEMECCDNCASDGRDEAESDCGMSSGWPTEQTT